MKTYQLHKMLIIVRHTEMFNLRVPCGIYMPQSILAVIQKYMRIL